MRRAAFSLTNALFLSTTILAATPAAAQLPPASNSRPVAPQLADATPLPKDAPYPGTMTLAVDATDTRQRIVRVKQTIPVAPEHRAAGEMVLLFPEWLPGNHAPRGQIEKLAGLIVTVDGARVQWVRDSLDVFAFRLPVGADARTVTAEFQFLSATAPNQGRVVVTDMMMNLQPNSFSLYPAGWYTRAIPVQMTVTYPDGWTAATALRGTVTGSTVAYAATDYDTLVDSPIFAGRHYRSWQLDPQVTLHAVADDPKELAASNEQIEAHRRLVREADALFGSRPFDHYDFLVSITDDMGSIGLEHHRSSENGVDPGYFVKWDERPGERNLLPHEYVHSWDGKHRRPELLWTPDFRTPMQDDLLWVYEGQTQFWGYVLGARSGLYTKEQTLDAYARIAAFYDLFKGRGWRPMGDTTHDPIISARRPKGWATWQRSEDYYNEGLLIWLEADGIIRQKTRGAKSMDDFARAFFGGKDGDWGVRTYDRAEVIATLNRVAAHDWAGFLAERVDRTNAEAPKRGLELGGYRLAYGDRPTSATKNYESIYEGVDQRFGIGILVKNKGDVGDIVWDSPAFAAGMTNGMSIVAVNGREFSADAFRAALEAKAPVDFVVKSGKSVRNIRVDYRDGLRYPRLEKAGSGQGGIDRLLTPRVR